MEGQIIVAEVVRDEMEIGKKTMRKLRMFTCVASSTFHFFKKKKSAKITCLL